MYRLQRVSITVGDVVIHCGHCVSTTTCFLPSDLLYSLFLWLFSSLFLLLGFDIHSKQSCHLPEPHTYGMQKKFSPLSGVCLSFSSVEYQ